MDKKKNHVKSLMVHHERRTALTECVKTVLHKLLHGDSVKDICQFLRNAFHHNSIFHLEIAV